MKTKDLKILIVDDEPKRSRDWAIKIESLNLEGVEITALDVDKAKSLIEAATHRRKEAREERKDPFSSEIKCELDEADILVVDYDLQELLQVGHWSTGLQVAALARAFTKVKFIVLVNQFGTNTFDLTLKKSLHSYADLDVGSDQLLNPAFWAKVSKSTYAPWSWGDGAISSAKRMPELIDWVAANLDKPALQALGFTAAAEEFSKENYLSKELWQVWTDAPENSFRDIVRTSELLTSKDREVIAEFDGPCAHVAAALTSHWLERWVIPANEVLIDLPHLASAYPWLLKQRATRDDWEATVSDDAQFSGLLPSVEKHEYSPGFKLSRPVVWRNKVLSDPDLAEPTGFTYDDFPDLVFCEDTSRFEEFSSARPFSSQLASSDTQRFVSGHKEHKEGDENTPFSGVLYEPSVFFSI